MNADYSADHITIDIDIAGLGEFGEFGDGGVDAAVQAKCEAVSGGADLLHYLWQVFAAVAQDMQYRPEYLAPQLTDIVDLDDGWRDERP